MGTATFSISKYGHKYQGVRGRFVASGAHTTSTVVSSLTDGAAGAGSAITANQGDVLTLKIDEDARIMFGGVDATATSGLIVYANTPTDLEVSGTGTIRIIDVA